MGPKATEEIITAEPTGLDSEPRSEPVLKRINTINKLNKHLPPESSVALTRMGTVVLNKGNLQRQNSLTRSHTTSLTRSRTRYEAASEDGSVTSGKPGPIKTLTRSSTTSLTRPRTLSRMNSGIPQSNITPLVRTQTMQFHAKDSLMKA